MNTNLRKSLTVLVLLAMAAFVSGCADTGVQAAPAQPAPAARPDLAYIEERFAMQDRPLAGPNIQDGEYRTFTFDAKDPRAYVTTTMTWYHVDGPNPPVGHSQGGCKAINPLDPLAAGDYRTEYVAPNGTIYVESELAGPNSGAGFTKHARSFPWTAGKWTVNVVWCGYNTDIALKVVGSNEFRPMHEHGTWR